MSPSLITYNQLVNVGINTYHTAQYLLHQLPYLVFVTNYVTTSLNKYKYRFRANIKRCHLPCLPQSLSMFSKYIAFLPTAQHQPMTTNQLCVDQSSTRSQQVNREKVDDVIMFILFKHYPKSNLRFSIKCIQYNVMKMLILTNLQKNDGE